MFIFVITVFNLSSDEKIVLVEMQDTLANFTKKVNFVSDKVFLGLNYFAKF